MSYLLSFFFFSSRRRHTRLQGDWSSDVCSSDLVPFLIAFSMLSFGMLEAFAARITVRRRGFPSGSPPPTRAATVISLISLVNTLPRLASAAPFLCLMVCHFECPDMEPLYWEKSVESIVSRGRPKSEEARRRSCGLLILSRRC